MNTAQKSVALIWIGVILLTALVPFGAPLVICVPLVAVALTFAAPPAARRRLEPFLLRPALVAIVSPQHLARAALLSLHCR